MRSRDGGEVTGGMAEWRNGGMKRQAAKATMATKATTPTPFTDPPSRRAAEPRWLFAFRVGRQRVHKLRRLAEAFDRHLGQRAPHRRLCRGREAWSQDRQIRDRSLKVLRQDRARCLAQVGDFSREHLVDHATEGVDVAATINPLAGPGLFRAHVGRRPHCDSLLRQAIGDPRLRAPWRCRSPPPEHAIR